MHIPKEEQKKLDPKSEKLMFDGYAETQKAFRFWNSKTKKIKISRYLYFIDDRITIPAFNLDSSASDTLIPPSRTNWS